MTIQTRRYLFVLWGLCLVAWTAHAEDKIIRMVAGGDCVDYTPTPSMVKTDGNRYPHNMIRVLADQWEKQHPGTRIELVTAPPASLNYRAWVVSNFVGGTIPHIIFQNMGSLRDSDFSKGWVVNMDPYLDRPNPYVPGNGRWLDQFYKPWVDALRSADGHCYWIAPDTVGVGLLYNKDILDKAGVTKLPGNLSEFVDACEKVERSGQLAYLALGSGGGEWYADCVLPSVVWADVIPKMDKDHNGIVSVMEEYEALHNGLFESKGPRLEEFLRIYEAISAFYPRGWSSMETLYMFRQGKVAFIEGLSMHMKKVEDDPMRDFEYGVISFPEVDEAFSPYGGHPLAGVGNAGYTSTWQITMNAAKDGVEEQCVDWLMFLTEPNHCEALVNEVGLTIPGVKGARPIVLFQPLMDATLKSISRPDYLDWHAFSPFLLTPECQTNYGIIKQCLALGMIDRREAIKRLEFLLYRSETTLTRKLSAMQQAAAE